MRLLGVAPESDWWRRCQPPECPKRKSTRECCIGLICRPLAGPSGLLGTHCAIEKTSCDGDRVVYELLREPPEVDGAARVGGESSMVYAIRNAQYATGVDRRYWTEFRVCYPCDADTPGLDPVACRCVTDGTGRPNDVGEYPWRDRSRYNPNFDLDLGWAKWGWLIPSASADSLASSLTHPNSNSFAKYYIHRCTKSGKRPSKPPFAHGWGFDFGRSGRPGYPPPWGGVVDARGERYE